MQRNDTDTIFQPWHFRQIRKCDERRRVYVLSMLSPFVDLFWTELLFAVLICMAVQKISRFSNILQKSGARMRRRKMMKKRSHGGEGRRRSGILVNLKQNLGSVSPAYTCRQGKAWRSLSNTFVPGAEKMIRCGYPSKEHKRRVLGMSGVWSISCSAKRDKRALVNTQEVNFRRRAR